MLVPWIQRVQVRRPILASFTCVCDVCDVVYCTISYFHLHFIFVFTLPHCIISSSTYLPSTSQPTSLPCLPILPHFIHSVLPNFFHFTSHSFLHHRTAESLCLAPTALTTNQEPWKSGNSMENKTL